MASKIKWTERLRTNKYVRWCLFWITSWRIGGWLREKILDYLWRKDDVVYFKEESEWPSELRRQEYPK